MALSLQSRVTLNDGSNMPVLGLGVWQAAAGKETRKAVAHALETGYRLIDTAKLYGNERDVGIAVRESGIPREEIFVTTKLWNSDHGYESALRAFQGAAANSAWSTWTCTSFIGRSPDSVKSPGRPCSNFESRVKCGRSESATT